MILLEHEAEQEQEPVHSVIRVSWLSWCFIHSQEEGLQPETHLQPEKTQGQDQEAATEREETEEKRKELE
jgi:hypothetical protein